MSLELWIVLNKQIINVKYYASKKLNQNVKLNLCIEVLYKSGETVI